VYKDFTAGITNAYRFFETYAKIDNFISDKPEVTFLRHGLSDGQAKDASLDAEAITLMEHSAFIEKVLRVNPDVIYTSSYVRCQQTAQKVQEILLKYRNKNIPICMEE